MSDATPTQEIKNSPVADKIDNLDDLIKSIDKQTEQKTDTTLPVISILPSFIEAIKGITEIISEHTGLMSVRLTDNDCKTLNVALKPLEKYIMNMVNMFIYLPLIVFAIGYTLRIISEVRDKKKDKVVKKAQEGFTVVRETAETKPEMINQSASGNNAT